MSHLESDSCIEGGGDTRVPEVEGCASGDCTGVGVRERKKKKEEIFVCLPALCCRSITLRLTARRL